MCLDSGGKPEFTDLVFRRGKLRFMAFDLLWDEHPSLDNEEEMRSFPNGEATRYLRSLSGKLRLRRLVPKEGERLLYSTSSGSVPLTRTSDFGMDALWRAPNRSRF